MNSADREAAGLEWLAGFERDRGRRLRVLHIGNIANNAYNNAKIQRARGIDADVACVDYYHVMGSPEWEDAEFEGDVGDPFFPDWWATDLRGFRRPRWFAQGRFAPCQRYLLALRQRRRLLAAFYWRRLELERWLRCRRTGPASAIRTTFASVPSASRRVRLGFARREALVRRSLRAFARRDLSTATAGALAIFRPAHADEVREALLPTSADHALAHRWVTLFPARSPLAREDYATYLDKIEQWRSLMAEYDVVQAYATASIIPVLCDVPFAAYEHGTLRETPFEETPLGRTAALGFREARVVFVTNSDVLPATERLGIQPERIVCLPHAVDSDRLAQFAAANRKVAPPGDQVVFLSPTRQDWRDADPSWTKGNDRAIRALALVRESGASCVLRLGEWGRDLEASKALVEALGVGDFVEWIPALRKTALWRAYLESHATLDQFVLPAIGGVTFEAMALGRRVITALDVPTAERFFGEGPPLLACSEPEEIAAAMLSVIADPGDRERLGARAAEWFTRRHSSDLIVGLQAAAYRRLVEATSLRTTP